MTDSPPSPSEREQAPADEEAEVVSRHLPPGYSAEPGVLSTDCGKFSESAPDPASPEPQDSLRLQGGDVHREIFKIGARSKVLQRATTFAHPSIRRSSTFAHPFTASDQRAPGGFRRQFFLQQQRRLQIVSTPVTKNFVSFLELYGSFAGENLRELEEDESIVDAEVESEAEAQSGETRPLLGQKKSSRHPIKPGDAKLTKSFFTLMKAFIGTGIMFLPKAFNNGGILFSSITLVSVSILSCTCFHLLLQCRKTCGGGGYGDLGLAIFGPKFRSLILSSITISQIGFVCAGVIFVAENLFSFLDAVTPSDTTPVSTNALIAIQLIVLIPLAMIRNISRLGPVALLADIFIFFGLFYIWYYDISVLASRGQHPSVTLFNPRDFTLTVGSAIFTFEGIGLILPIQSSMAQPERFSRLLYAVMLIITIIFTSIGALCYATFGSNTRVEIISNFPQDSRLVNIVQLLYSLAVLVGTPVQLFPATRIIETSLFGERASGKQSMAMKWKKNALRAGLTILCGVIAILGASDLDKFVALIGSFACVPLVYIYPALLHYKGIASGRWVKAGNVGIMVVGVCAMVYTTVITVTSWVQD